MKRRDLLVYKNTDWRSAEIGARHRVAAVVMVLASLYHVYYVFFVPRGKQLLRDLGDHEGMILRNHGLLAWGDSIPRAFAILWLLNRACEIQLASTAMGPVIDTTSLVASSNRRASCRSSSR